MTKFSEMLSLMLIISFLAIKMLCYAQTDLTTITNQVDSIITSVVGVDNFQKHISFNKARSKCDLWTGAAYLGSSTFESDKVKFNPNQYDLWYDLDLVKDNYLTDVIFVRIFVNSKQTEIYISGIPQCLSDTFYCDKFISLNQAKKIAEDGGLAKGLEEWETRFVWKKEGVVYLQDDSIKIVLDKGCYYWSVSNVLTIRSPNPCVNGTGENIEINAITREASNKNKIYISCVN